MNRKVPQHGRSSRGGSALKTAELRDRLRELTGSATVRELARRMAMSHVTLLRFLAGDSPRASTLARIESYLREPGEADVVERLRRDLSRLLGGLRARDRKAVERELAAAIERAYSAGKLEVPAWVAALGKKQV